MFANSASWEDQWGTMQGQRDSNVKCNARSRHQRSQPHAIQQLITFYQQISRMVKHSCSVITEVSINIERKGSGKLRDGSDVRGLQ